MPVGAAIGGAAIIGGVATNRAADRTARAAETTATNNNALAREVYNRNVQIQMPYLAGGNRSLEAWASLMGLGEPTPGVSSVANGGAVGNALRPGLARRGYEMSGAEDFEGPQVNPGPNGQATRPNALSGYDSFRNSLGYQQGLDEGNRSLNLRLANRGQLLSGDAAREAVRFNSDYAQRWAGNYLDRLMQGTMLGAGAANALSGVGTNYASGVAANNNNALSVQSGAWQQGAQGTSDMAGNLAGAFAYGYGNNWGRNPAATASSYQQASSGFGRPLNW